MLIPFLTLLTLTAADSPAEYETVVRTEQHEDDIIGEYAQPRWTATRRFPTTRIFVLPKGAMNVEYWFDTKTVFSDASNTRFRNLYEIEWGLGHRLQLDLYLRTQQEGLEGPMQVQSEKIELRYAFADWDELFGNPTLYVEFSRNTDASPTLETKLLFGGNIAPRVHWGLNLVYERDLKGPNPVNQYGLTGGLSYALIDRTFSLGAELQIESEDDGVDHNRLQELSIVGGPSIQWRPLPALTIDLAVMFGGLGEREAGIEYEAGARTLLVIGWQF